MAPGTSARVQRIVDSRKTANGRLTRQSKKGTSNCEQGEGASLGASSDPPATQSLSVVVELIDMNQPSPNHPSQVGKVLKTKGFSNFSEIEKVGKFRFKITTEDIRRLKKVNLEDNNLRFYEPKITNHTLIFVRGVPPAFEEEEMLENMEADSPILKVQRLKRLGRDKQLFDTYNIKVTVEGEEVPNRVRIYGCSFRAELYIFPIRQCQNCWRYGHRSKHCTSRTRCASCGGSHNESACDKEARCPNCKGGHKAGDPSCPELQRHKKIRLAMKEKQIPFNQAESHYPRLENRFGLLNEEEAGGSHPFPSLLDEQQGTTASLSPGRERSLSTASQRRERQDRQSPPAVPIDAPPTSSSSKDPEPRCHRCPENPIKATDFERIISWLRTEFLAEVRSKRWLVALKDIHAKIAFKVQSFETELDRDQLLIEVSQDIQQIIVENTQHQHEETRTNQYQHSGV